MKIYFKCCHCSEEFNVKDNNLVKKQALECPNCGAVFPKEALDKLINAVRSIDNAKSILEIPKPENVITSRKFYSWEFTFIED